MAATSSPMTTTAKNEDKNKNLGYYVKEIHIGIVVSKEDIEYGKEIGNSILKLFPDRFVVHILFNDTAEEDDSCNHWPFVNLLILCCSKVNFPSLQASNYFNKQKQDNNNSIMVLTDFDIQRNIKNRCILYDILSSGGVSEFLPRKAYYKIDAEEDDDGIFIDRRDQLEINGKILLKPILERPINPANQQVKIYYPRRHGGGCKIIDFIYDNKNTDTSNNNYYTTLTAKSNGKFDCETSYIQRQQKSDNNNSGYIYEELTITNPSQNQQSKELTKSISKDPSEKLMEITTSKRNILFQRKRLSSQNQQLLPDDEQISYDSDLSRFDRKIYVVTTASIPWMTGTAVNPLLRVAYLKSQVDPNTDQEGRPSGSVTLVIPWLAKEEDRIKVYGTDNVFNSVEEQEKYVRDWLINQANKPKEADPENGIKIIWYPAKYYEAYGSIFPTDDICKLIPDEDADFCILEEPEHLNWFRSPEETNKIWTEKFTHVVGIIHTNYRSYVTAASPIIAVGAVAAPIVSGLSSLMVRAYCDKVIKLSGTLQNYAPEKEVVCNVHGVRADFILEGKRRAEQDLMNQQVEIAALEGGDVEIIGDKNNDSTSTEQEQVEGYFIAKILWEKGLDRLLRLEYFYKEVTGEFFPFDIIGDGPDREAIEDAFYGTEKASKAIRRILANDDYDNQYTNFFFNTKKKNDQLDELRKDISRQSSSVDDSSGGIAAEDIETYVPKSMQLQTSKIPVNFHGRQDHANFCKKYKYIINPSVTEVLCTTTAEALAMGKFAIIPKHPSNVFFEQFPNCLLFETKVEFVTQLVYAMNHEPVPLSDELSYIFTWEAATDRLIYSSGVTMKMERSKARKSARRVKNDIKIGKMYNKIGGKVRKAKHDGENFKNTVLNILLGGTSSNVSDVDSNSEDEDNNVDSGKDKNEPNKG